MNDAELLAEIYRRVSSSPSFARKVMNLVVESTFERADQENVRRVEAEQALTLALSAMHGRLTKSSLALLMPYISQALERFKK